MGVQLKVLQWRESVFQAVVRGHSQSCQTLHNVLCVLLSLPITLCKRLRDYCTTLCFVSLHGRALCHTLCIVGTRRIAQPDSFSACTGNRGGQSVAVEGSFDNWTSRTQLQKTGNHFTIVKLLSPGVYQYKFIVDGEWQYDPGQPAMYDERNNVNNVLEVQEYAPENLDSLNVFEQPPSPDSSYGRPEVRLLLMASSIVGLTRHRNSVGAVQSSKLAEHELKHGTYRSLLTSNLHWLWLDDT